MTDYIKRGIEDKDGWARNFVGAEIDLLDDLYFYVVGLYEDGTPRYPLTMQDCQERFDTIPKKGTVDELRQLVEDYKPVCECGKKATIWYKDVEVIETYPKNLLPKKVVTTTIWVCDEHRRSNDG